MVNGIVLCKLQYEIEQEDRVIINIQPHGNM